MPFSIKLDITVCVLLLIHVNHCQSYRRSDNVSSSSYEKILIPLTQKMTLVDAQSQSRPILDYFTTVKIGSQNFEIKIDTGTDEIWIPSWYGVNDNLHHKNPSPGYSNLLNQTDIGVEEFLYKNINLRGTIHEDKFKFTGRDSNNLEKQVLFMQNFLAVTETNSSRYKNRPFDGVLGLIANTIDGPKTEKLQLSNIFGSAFPTEITSDDYSEDHHMRFSFWFDNRIPDLLNRYQYGGEFTFGGFNEERADGPIKTHRAVDDKWHLELQGVYYENARINNEINQTTIARLDTGLPYILGPMSEVEKFYDEIGAKVGGDNKTWTVNCSSYLDLGKLSFKFGGTPYEINSNFYITKVNHPKLGEYCFVNMMGYQTDYWILGTSFLRAYYMQYDPLYGDVGIAASKQYC